MRVVQGLGAGAIGPIVLTLLGDLFTLEERAKVQGLFSAVWGVSSVAGPWLGGLPDRQPLVAMGLLRDRPVRAWSRPGSWSATSSEDVRRDRGPADRLARRRRCWRPARRCSCWRSSEGPRPRSASVAGLCWRGGGAPGAGSSAVERRAADPILPPDLFARVPIAAAIAGSFLIGALLFGIDTYVPLYVQGVAGRQGDRGGRGDHAAVPLLGDQRGRGGQGGGPVRVPGDGVVGMGMIAAGDGRPGAGGRPPGSAALSCSRSSLVVIGLGFGPASLCCILGRPERGRLEPPGRGHRGRDVRRVLGGALGVGVLGATLAFEFARRLASAGAGGIDVVAALRPETHALLTADQLRLVQGPWAGPSATSSSRCSPGVVAILARPAGRRPGRLAGRAPRHLPSRPCTCPISGGARMTSRPASHMMGRVSSSLHAHHLEARASRRVTMTSNGPRLRLLASLLALALARRSRPGRRSRRDRLEAQGRPAGPAAGGPDARRTSRSRSRPTSAAGARPSIRPRRASSWRSARTPSTTTSARSGTSRPGSWSASFKGQLGFDDKTVALSPDGAYLAGKTTLRQRRRGPARRRTAGWPSRSTPTRRSSTSSTSPAGDRVVFGRLQDRKLQVCDIKSGDKVCDLDPGQGGRPRGVAFSPGRAYLAVASWCDGTAPGLRPGHRQARRRGPHAQAERPERPLLRPGLLARRLRAGRPVRVLRRPTGSSAGTPPTARWSADFDLGKEITRSPTFYKAGGSTGSPTSRPGWSWATRSSTGPPARRSGPPLRRQEPQAQPPAVPRRRARPGRHATSPSMALRTAVIPRDKIAGAVEDRPLRRQRRRRLAPAR